MPEAAVQEARPQSDLPNTNTSPPPPPPPPPTPEAPFIYPRQQQSVVLSHWYALIPNFNTSPREFYAALDKELGERQIPGLSVNRTEYAEGGILSGQRQYLHLSRERLIFDICAAPFGTSYFFSCRFAENTPKVQLAHVLAVLLSFGTAWLVARQWASWWNAAIIVLLALLLLMALVRNATALGLSDLDTWLLNSPVLGGMYLQWFRKDTYYRQDTRLMYLESVNAITKELVQHVTGSNGIHLVCFKEHSPILGELYKPSPPQVPPAPKPA